MKHANKIIDRAFSYFRIGYNCAESVLLAIAKDASEIDCDLIPKIATGFGGGISRQGYVCGAVSGAVMGFGLKYGRNSPEELSKNIQSSSRVLQTVSKDVWKYCL